MLNQIPDKILKLFFDGDEIIILKKFFEKERILDFDLSDETGIHINKVRKILQEFNYNSFMNYDKLKSEKKEFWYDYVWYIRKADFYSYLYKNLKSLCDDLERRIEICSSTMSFICPKCKDSFQFAEALDCNFNCPKCECILQEMFFDPEKYKEKLKFYKHWLEKIKKYARDEESLDIEELIK